jgi:RNA polymerase sigma factor (sigma-70 family)
VRVSLSGLPEKELIARIKRAEKGSDDRKQFFAHLWCTHERTIEKMLNKSAGYGPRDVDPQDIKQDVALKLWGSIDDYKGEVPFAHWLRRVVESCRVDAMRKVMPRRYLFSLDVTEETEEELNKGFVPVELREMFKTKRVSLAEDAAVNKQEGEWVISAGRGTYIVRTEGTKLKIYRQRLVEKPATHYQKTEEEMSEGEVLDRLSGYTSVYHTDDTTFEIVTATMTKEILKKALVIKAQMGKKEAKSAHVMELAFQQDLPRLEIAKLIHKKSERTVYRYIHEDVPVYRDILRKHFGITDISDI